MYAVLSTKVKTDCGKAIVRKYDITFDAQKVYEKLTEHHLRSPKSSINAFTILTYITSAKLGTGAWNGYTETFIIHWDVQVIFYEKQVKKATTFTDVNKKAMLENAVILISELRQEKLLLIMKQHVLALISHLMHTYIYYCLPLQHMITV
jgi:hypothetical protein